MHNKRFLRGALAAAVIMSVLTGCDAESHATMLSQAKQYHQKGELSAAVIVLKNAVEAVPDHGETRYELATVYLDTGDGISAEKEIRMALKHGYRGDLALPVLGRALQMQGQFQKVLDETAAESKVKHGAELLSVRADALLALGKHAEAKQIYQSVLASAPAFTPALIGMGRVAVLARDVDSAVTFADQALAAAPRNTDALLFKGDLLRAQNRPQQALAAYDQVVALAPQHRSAHIEKAYLKTAMGKFESAQADLDAARKLAPGSVLVSYTQALLDFSQSKYAGAQEAMQNVLRVAPEHMPSVLLAGAISLNLGSLHQAEHHLRHYLEKNPDNLYARKMLASTLLRSGHTPDALSVLAPALSDPRQDVQVLALAGESYMQARDFTKAAELFEKASAMDPKAAKLRTSLALSRLGKGDQAQAVSDLQLATTLDATSPQAGIALVRTELGLQRIDNAYAAVIALEKAQPDNAAVQDLKGLVHVGKQDLAQARASFAKALALQPSYFPAAANLAQLELRNKKPAAARQHLLAFLEKNPTNIDAMTALASLSASDGKKEEATKWLEQASAVNPNAIAPAVNLIGQYLQTGLNQKALDTAAKLQVVHRDNPDLLDLLGKGQLANGEKENALDTYKKLAVALPRSAHAQMQVAALHLMMKRSAAAEEYLKAALAMQPDFPAAQLALAELYVRKGWNELALMTAASLQRNHPKAAAGFQLEGDVNMAQGKPALALDAYEQAIAFSKTSELTIKAANALRAAGRQDEGGKRLAAWLKQHPDDVRVQLYKAETLLADKQYKPAAEHFEAILKRQPDNVIALNNLALAYQQSQDARATAVAGQAYKLANDEPVIMDTYGWILVEQGDTARGLPILQRASAKAPQARDIRYHVAMGLFKAGDKAAARKELDVLLAGNMKFAQAEEARALLKQLQ
ncbi:MAG: XrtA/PEP-CTERM system TPR-repeat protein PrsT [Pseudomonadota bacterium]